MDLPPQTPHPILGPLGTPQLGLPPHPDLQGAPLRQVELLGGSLPRADLPFQELMGVFHLLVELEDTESLGAVGLKLGFHHREQVGVVLLEGFLHQATLPYLGSQ